MIEAFLSYITTEVQLSKATVDAYETDLRQWIDFATDSGRYELAPESTTIADLRLWISNISRKGASPRTIRRKIQALRAFFRFMMKRHGMKINPALQLKSPKIAKDLPVYIRTEEIASMLDSEIDMNDAEQVRNRLIIDMFYTTGLRCSELMTLLDRNINTLQGELKVHGKRNKDRIVPFGAELGESIEKYRMIRDSQEDFIKGETLFQRKNGSPLSRKQIYNIVHRELTESGAHASRKSPHVLRHSFATDMLNGGADLTSVQQLLGHESLTATQVYTHLSYRDLKQNYQLAHPRAQKEGG